jgi:hypothetical protein
MRLTFAVVVGLFYSLITWLFAWLIIILDKFITPVDILIKGEYSYLKWGILGVFLLCTIVMRAYLHFFDDKGVYRGHYNRFQIHK